MSTQISSNCITNTSICNGTYECGGDTEFAIMARVVPLFRTDEEWDKSQSYEALTIIRHNELLYISKVPVPCGIELDNCKYWTVYAQSVNWDEIQRRIDAGDKAVREELIAAYTEADAELRSLIDTLSATVGEQRAKLEEHTTDIAANATAISEQGAKIAAAEARNEEQDEEIARVSGNTDALSARLDDLEQNGGSGITALQDRVTAVETVNEQQAQTLTTVGSEVESVVTQVDGIVVDVNSLGERVQGNTEQIGQDQAALAQLITGSGTEESPWAKGPKMEEWASGGAGVDLPLPISQGGTGKTTRGAAVNALLNYPKGPVGRENGAFFYRGGLGTNDWEDNQEQNARGSLFIEIPQNNSYAPKFAYFTLANIPYRTQSGGLAYNQRAFIGNNPSTWQQIAMLSDIPENSDNSPLPFTMLRQQFKFSSITNTGLVVLNTEAQVKSGYISTVGSSATGTLSVSYDPKTSNDSQPCSGLEIWVQLQNVTPSTYKYASVDLTMLFERLGLIYVPNRTTFGSVIGTNKGSSRTSTGIPTLTQFVVSTNTQNVSPNHFMLTFDCGSGTTSTTVQLHAVF